MAQDDSKASLEDRLALLEKEKFSADDAELLRFVIKSIKAARGTIWLTNGFVKYILPPLGVAWGFYHWGADMITWARGQ
jgi:hypothetical protein